jgi:polyribonucleotide nucleotidyltransferase
VPVEPDPQDLRVELDLVVAGTAAAVLMVSRKPTAFRKT